MSERRKRGGGTKRRERGIGGKEEEGTLLISFPPTSEPWRRHLQEVIFHGEIYVGNVRGELVPRWVSGVHCPYPSARIPVSTCSGCDL